MKIVYFVFCNVKQWRNDSVNDFINYEHLVQSC